MELVIEKKIVSSNENDGHKKVLHSAEYIIAADTIKKELDMTRWKLKATYATPTSVIDACKPLKKSMSYRVAYSAESTSSNDVMTIYDVLVGIIGDSIHRVSFCSPESKKIFSDTIEEVKTRLSGTELCLFGENLYWRSSIVGMIRLFSSHKLIGELVIGSAIVGSMTITTFDTTIFDEKELLAKWLIKPVCEF